MHVTPTSIPGAVLISQTRHEDERGYFARTWDPDILQAYGLETRLAQCSVAYNHRAGTLRGLHFQSAPHEEAKIVRCTRGRVFDVIVDVRPESPTFGQWVAVELTDTDGAALYVPPGCAHGYQTLEDASELLYLISEPYHPALSRGIRWDDPTIGIEWPACSERIISERDQALPALVS